MNGVLYRDQCSYAMYCSIDMYMYIVVAQYKYTKVWVKIPPKHQIQPIKLVYSLHLYLSRFHRNFFLENSGLALLQDLVL